MLSLARDRKLHIMDYVQRQFAYTTSAGIAFLAVAVTMLRLSV